ncbi:MAG TPA: multidrug effflux MFS transporter [Sphingomonas sp.]|nr:multidrug effflux MFS transporter [Sphingomonas sp.]
MHAPAPSHPFQLRLAEFVAMIAGLMAMAALSTDSMLPALPAIGASLHVGNPNDRQAVISTFMLGFGMAQIVYGPLSDRFGRRPTIMVSLVLAVALNLVAAFAASFTLLLAARFACGLALAACRVLSISIVRDRFAGDHMARVMSLVSIVFMIVPIIAPNLGQAIIAIAHWRWIFGVMALAALMLFIWVAIRLPETLNPAHRLPLSLARMGEGFRYVLTDRQALGYASAATLLQGGMFGFILSVEQVFENAFHAPRLLGPMFSVIASAMIAASFLNSRIVTQFGARAVSHRAVLGYTGFALLHLAVAAAGLETLAGFAVLQALTLACFGLAGANCNAIAMEHMGRIAGTASSVQGMMQTVGGVAIGASIGAAFNGTTVPLYAGFALCGLLAFGAIAFAEQGRLFGRA